MCIDMVFYLTRNCGDGSIGPFDTRADHKNNQMMIIFDSKDSSTASGTGFTATVQAYRGQLVVLASA